MAHVGILAQNDRFEIIAGDQALGPRRDLDAKAVATLEGFAERYRLILHTPANAAAVPALGRDLYRWLDGDEGQLTTLISQARPPLRFVVQGPPRPSRPEWALLRVPFELLVLLACQNDRRRGAGAVPMPDLCRPDVLAPGLNLRVAVPHLLPAPNRHDRPLPRRSLSAPGVARPR